MNRLLSRGRALLPAIQQVCGVRNYSSNLQLRLFTSPHCILCRQFKQQLEPYLLEGVLLEEVDITKPENSEWFNKYRYDIPVLHVEERLAQKHFFDPDSFLDEIEQFKLSETR